VLQVFPKGRDAMGPANRDVLRAIALARILTRHIFARLRYSITLWSILAGIIGITSILIIAPWGCTPKTNEAAIPLSGRTIRVRLLQGQEQITLKPAAAFIYRADAGDRQMNVAAGTLIPLRLTPTGWLAGNMNLGKGVLTLRPIVEGQVRINDRNYRGQYRLLPLEGNKFDVINDVELDDYLKSVLSKELYANWQEETYKAQAVAARTYALYEKYSRSEDRSFDVHSDVRSQAYGGMDSETPKSRKAVEETAGIVLATGSDGNERIFKAYFSSTCGGVTQAVTVFNEPTLQPLSEQYVGTLCSASPKYSWGPIVVGKDELSQRIKKWFTNRQRSQVPALPIRAIDIEIRNRFGRPMRFGVIDAKGMRFSLLAEELRWAVNTDAPDNQKMPSSFVENIINDYDKIHFIGGRGYGHGVGLCQYCAEARAKAGMRHEDILLAAYPGARLLRAY
jgi:stage II sporulation protein D